MVSLTGIIINVIILFTYIYDIATYLVYFLIYRPWIQKANIKKKRMKLVSEILNEEKTFQSCEKSYCRPVREVQDLGFDTLDQLFRYAITKFADKPALGTRKILSEKTETEANGKIINKYKMENHYTWKTYKEFGVESSWFGSGLREIGINPGSKIVIFAETKAKWLISAIGCFKNNISLVTIYPNLGVDGLVESVHQTEAQVIITCSELYPKLAEIAPEKMDKVKKVIFFEHTITESKDPKKISDQYEIYSYQDIINKGKNSSIPESPPTAKDPAIIMYTSGSTGIPKGVIISHGNICSAIYSIANPAVEVLGSEPSPDYCYLSFLPLAHVLELIIETSLVLYGVKVGYSTPLTLTDLSTGIIKGDKGDASILKPTIMAAVPVVLDRVYKGIQNKLSKNDFLRQLIEWAYNYRLTWLKRGFDTPILNKIIFQQLKKVIGGRLNLILCGGAPVASTVHTFIQTCLNLKIIIGYGSTETCGVACATDMYDLNTERIGCPQLGCNVKIINWEEGEYYVDDDKNGIRGEICISGSNVTNGYFINKEEISSQDFFKDKNSNEIYFRTGDIGMVMEDNMTIKVIDRKKDLIKLQFGEYVSLGKIESYIKTHPLIDNFAAYADPMKSCVVGLCVPDVSNLEELALNEFNGRKIGMTREQLCADSEVIKYIKDILTEKFSEKLLKMEIPKNIRLISELWTPESGLITASIKLKRKPIFIKYKNLIDEMYSQLKDEK